ncbi:hypothetical protein [Streptomyces sp. NPDC001667]
MAVVSLRRPVPDALSRRTDVSHGPETVLLMHSIVVRDQPVGHWLLCHGS